MQPYSDILTTDGLVPGGLEKAVPGASVWVFKSTGALESLNDDTGNPIVQPIISGPLGEVDFNVPDPGDLYDLEYHYGGRLLRRDRIFIGTIGGEDAYSDLSALLRTAGGAQAVANKAMYAYDMPALQVLFGDTDQSPGLEYIDSFARRLGDFTVFQIRVSARDKSAPGGALTIAGLPIVADGIAPQPLTVRTSGFPDGACASLSGNTIAFAASDGRSITDADMTATWAVQIDGKVTVLPQPGPLDDDQFTPLAFADLSNTTGFIVPATPQARTLGARFGEVVNVDDWLTGNAFTDVEKTAELAQLQAAVNYAFTTSGTLLIPRNASMVRRINGSVTIPAGGINIGGGGRIYSTADAPVFITTEGMFNRDVGDFETFFELTDVPAAACSIKFTGVSTSYADLIYYCRFADITCYGGLATIINEKSTITTAFGMECLASFNLFDNIWCFPYNQDIRNAVWFKTGSGTGNIFRGFKGRPGQTASAYARFDGAGCVVGDILFVDAHIDASLTAGVDCAAVEVGPNTVYRSNIAVLTSQTDAGVPRVFRLSSVGSVDYRDIKHDGSLIGGGTTLGIDTPIASPQIDDRDEGRWTGGISPVTVLGSGTKKAALCTVTLAQYSCVIAAVAVGGKVGGVNAGGCDVKIVMRTDTSTADPQVSTIASYPAGLFTVTAEVSGLVVSLYANFTPTADSEFWSTWDMRGGRFFVTRS